MKFGTRGSNQREGLSSKITLVKIYGRWTILMEFIELRMKVTVNKCATLKINIMYIYIQQTLKLQMQLIRFKTSLRSTGVAINTT